MKLTIKDGRDHFYTFDTNRILLLTATDEENIRQVEFSTEENGEELSWTSEVLTGSDGVKYVQVPNEFLNGDYTRLVCYYVALDSNGEYTRQKEIFRIRARQEPQDYYLTYSERVTFASIKALTEQYKATTKQYMDTTEGFKDNAGRSAELASKYAENNENVAVEPGKYSAKHWSIKAEAAKETAVQKATEASTSEVNSKTYMESAQSAKQDAETAKNAANTILEQVQSKGTEITNFVATSKTEIETQKNESVNAVTSVYQTDLNELKGDLSDLSNLTNKKIEYDFPLNWTIGKYLYKANGNFLVDANCAVTEDYYKVRKGQILQVKLVGNSSDVAVCFYDTSKRYTYSSENYVGISSDANFPVQVVVPFDGYARFGNATNKIPLTDVYIKNASPSTYDSAIKNLNVNLSNKIEENHDNIERMNGIISYKPVVGNVYISLNGWVYQDNVHDGIITKKGTTVKLNAGSVISLKSDDFKINVGWRYTDGTYSYSGWYDSPIDYVVKHDAEYVFLVKYKDNRACYESDISVVENNLIVMENYSKIYSDYLPNKNFVSIAHRGNQQTSPENTISAFKSAVDMHFDAFETDVHRTLDGKYVCIHDYTVDRTSNGTGNVEDMTLEQLKSLDFGSWYSPNFVGEKIPTFEEMVRFSKKMGITPYVEFKEHQSWSNETIDDLIEIVRNYDMMDKLVWLCYPSNNLSYLASTYPKARIAILGNATEDNINYYKRNNCTDGIFPYSTELSDDDIINARSEGIPLGFSVFVNLEQIKNINPYFSMGISDVGNPSSLMIHFESDN